MSVTAYLSLGSNLGDREDTLAQARKLLARIPGLRIGEVSRLFQTAPVELLAQPWFLNQVVQVEWESSAQDLLSALLGVEQELGRVRTVRFGPRTIDIDLLLFGETVLESATLVLPHPRMHQRAFVLVPLCEIAPQAMHPRLKKSAADLLCSLPDAGGVEPWLRPAGAQTGA